MSIYSSISNAVLKVFIEQIEAFFVQKEGGKGLSEENFTSALLSKLNSLETPINNLSSTSTTAPLSAYQGNVLSGLITQVQNAIPTAVSELTNDSGFQTAQNVINYVTNYLVSEGYITETEIQGLIDTAISEAISEITQIRMEAVDELPDPSEAEENVIYLVPSEEEGVRNQYIWTGDEFVRIGSTEVDLTGLVTETDLETTLEDYVKHEDIHELTEMEFLSIWAEVFGS